jgi:hypothetical protein
MGISLSRNRGKDWEFLRNNIGIPMQQSLHLTDDALFVMRWQDDPSPRRFTFADRKWDSLSLPGSGLYSQRVFATLGNRIVWFALSGPTGDSIFLSRDRGVGGLGTRADRALQCNKPSPGGLGRFGAFPV